MNNIIIYLIFIPFIGLLLLIINYLFQKHHNEKEKISPFECGFVGFTGQTRSPFSISFYLVGLLFLIFDLEIALLYPYLITVYYNSLYGLIIVLIFLLILTIGFIYEISKGALKIIKQDNSLNQDYYYK